MRILISGGAGMIGRPLSARLVEQGHTVTVLTRRPDAVRLPPGVRAAAWDGRTPAGWESLVEECQAIFHLAGENIGAQRWSAQRKAQLLDSRLESGRAVVEAIRQARTRPALLIQASAVGVYGASLTETFTDGSARGTDFMARLASAWEDSTLPVEELGVRRVIARTGLVLDRSEGVLPRWMLPFRLFAGGPLGSGRQWQSWIHRQDEIDALVWLLNKPGAAGPFNLTALNPVTNAQLGKILARVMRRPYWMPAPAFLLRAVLGEMSALVLEGQRVLPVRLVESGFHFQFTTLEDALRDILRPGSPA